MLAAEVRRRVEALRTHWEIARKAVVKRVRSVSTKLVANRLQMRIASNLKWNLGIVGGLSE